MCGLLATSLAGALRQPQEAYSRTGRRQGQVPSPNAPLHSTSTASTGKGPETFDDGDALFGAVCAHELEGIRRTTIARKHGFLSLGLSARLPPASSRQLPISSFEEWHSVASGVEAVDLDLVAADHQVRVDVGAVDAHVP